MALFSGALGGGVGGVVWVYSAKELGLGLIIGMLAEARPFLAWRSLQEERDYWSPNFEIFLYGANKQP